jgi:DNA-binding NtrC family response regulator
VRLICTQSNALQLSRLHLIAADFYKIIAQIVLQVPSLENNPENIMPLANNFLFKYKFKNKKNILGLDNEAQKFLLNHCCLGSVKELKALIVESASKCEEFQKIGKNILKAALNSFQKINKSQIKKDNILQDRLKSYEINLIKQMLLQTQGNLSLSAKKLGVPRRTLTYKCAKLGINRVSQ